MATFETFFGFSRRVDPTHSRRFLCGRFVAIVCLLSLQTTHAQTIAWTGDTTGTQVLTTGSNWAGGAVPTSSQTALFNLSAFGSDLHLSAVDWHVLGILVDTKAGPLTFSSTGGGSAKTIFIGAGGITNSSINTVAFNVSTKVNLALDASASFTANGPITIVSGSLFTIGAFTLTLNGTDTGASIGQEFSGTGNLIKSGTGTWVLSGANTYTGTTSISEGTLSVSSIVVSGSSSSNLGNAGSAVVLGGETTAGTLSYTGNSTTYSRGFTVNAGGGGVDVTTSSQTLTIATGGVATSGVFTVGGAGSMTISSAITGSGSIAKTGTGSLTLTGANTFTGGASLASGPLTVNSGSTLGSSSTPGPLSLTGGALNLNNTAQTVSSLSGTGGTITLAADHTLTDNQSTSTSFGGSITGAGGFIKSGSGTLTVTGANTQTGGTTVGGGILQLGNGGTTGSFAGSITTTDNSTLTFNRSDDISFSQVISGAGSLNKSGAGQLTLLAQQTFTGSTTVSSGILVLAAETGGIQVANTLPVTTNLALLDSATLRVDTNQTIRRFLTTDSKSSIAVANSHVFTVALGTETTSTEFNGVISGQGGFAVGASTAGRIVSLLGNNTYTGGTTIDIGAKLMLGNGGTAGSVAGNVVNNGGLIFNRADQSQFTGTISGIGSVSQASPSTGTTVITAANSFSGGTTVTSGTIIAAHSNALGSGTVQLNGGAIGAATGAVVPNSLSLSSGKIGGSGGFGSAVIGAGVTVAPELLSATTSTASSIATLTFESLTLASGGTYEWNLLNPGGTAGTGGGWDLLSISGTLPLLTVSATAASPFTLKLVSLSGAGVTGTASGFLNQNYSWTIISNTGTSIVGFESSKFMIDSSAFGTNLNTGSFFLSQSAGNLVLNFTPVPEPTTWALIGTGAAIVFLRVRRRKS